jgi:hypothetical protein
MQIATGFPTRRGPLDPFLCNYGDYVDFSAECRSKTAQDALATCANAAIDDSVEVRWHDNSGIRADTGRAAEPEASPASAVAPPVVMTNGTDGTRVNADLIRKNRIAPALRHDEWARAGVAAANGLETAG